MRRLTRRELRHIPCECCKHWWEWCECEAGVCAVCERCERHCECVGAA